MRHTSKLALTMLACSLAPWGAPALAPSHREAPLIVIDPAADNTDGQRAETFYIDLGAVFDTLNLRRRLPALTGSGEDSDFVNPFGINRFSGANVSTIAIEVPLAVAGYALGGRCACG